jgi:GT2 family glycosyltransferase
MNRVAVVILNYNGEKLLPQFLPSVLQHTANADIYVADNGSTDQSIQLLQNNYPNVKLILLQKNYGFCGGYNRALEQIDADYYILLNSDIEVTANWITPMIRLMNGDDSIGAVQPKILSYVNRNVFEYAGAAGGFIDALGYPFCRGRIFNYVETDDHQYNDTRQTFWASGACLMIKADLYRQFNGFDEDFFAHMEEIDLCWKIQRAGYKVFYCGESTVYHLGAGTLDYGSPQKTYLNFRNGLALITKHFSPTEILYKLPVRIGLDWVAMIMFLLKGQLSHSKAVLKAHWHWVTHLKITIQKRKNIRQLFPDYPKETIYPGLALFQFFVRGRRRLV